MLVVVVVVVSTSAATTSPAAAAAVAAAGPAITARECLVVRADFDFSGWRRVPFDVFCASPSCVFV